MRLFDTRVRIVIEDTIDGSYAKIMRRIVPGWWKTVSTTPMRKGTADTLIDIADHYRAMAEKFGNKTLSRTERKRLGLALGKAWAVK
jgi:hypothetical protein